MRPHGNCEEESRQFWAHCYDIKNDAFRKGCARGVERGFVVVIA